MRRYTLYNQLMAVAAGLCLCWLCVACGEDRGGDLPNDDPNSCVVTITLRTSRSARPPQTKAGEMMTKADFWEEEEDQYERDITDWLVWRMMMRTLNWPDIHLAMVRGRRVSIILILVRR